MKRPAPEGARAGTRVERHALTGFVFFTLAAVGGYWSFGLHPELLPASDFAIRVYQISFPWFARAQIVVSAGVLLLVLTVRSRLRWLPAAAAVYLLSFVAEHVGTGYGFPFSGYEYTGLLGPKLLGRVPYLIPLSWFVMAAPAWVLARASFPETRQWLPRIAQASFLLVLWDLALDPAMSFLAPYWVWENPGAFYGMPWVNLVGWVGTGMVLMAALEFLQARLDWAGDISVGWVLAYYLTVLAMPLGMVTAAGLWGAVGLTLAALAVAGGVHLRFGGRARKRAGGAAPGLSGGVAEAAS